MQTSKVEELSFGLDNRSKFWRLIQTFSEPLASAKLGQKSLQNKISHEVGSIPVVHEATEMF